MAPTPKPINFDYAVMLAWGCSGPGVVNPRPVIEMPLRGADPTITGWGNAQAFLQQSFFPEWLDKDLVFAEIIKFRDRIEFPTEYKGNPEVDRVVAFFYINSSRYCSSNDWISRSGRAWKGVWDTQRETYGFRINQKTYKHAEGGALFEAVETRERADFAVLFVDAPFCNSCGFPFFGLRPYLKELGVKELVVFVRLPNGHVVSGRYHVGD